MFQKLGLECSYTKGKKKKKKTVLKIISEL